MLTNYLKGIQPVTEIENPDYEQEQEPQPIPLNQLEALEREREREQEAEAERSEGENEPYDVLTDLQTQLWESYDQAVQRFNPPIEQTSRGRAPDEREQPVHDERIDQILRWTQRRQEIANVPQHLLGRGSGIGVRSVRAHDSDLLLTRAGVLVPSGRLEAGVSIPMFFDDLNLDIVVARPWTIHNFYGIRYEENSLELPRSRDKVDVRPLTEGMRTVFRTVVHRLGLNPDEVERLGWDVLNTQLGVLSENDGISTIQVYTILLMRREIERLKRVDDAIFDLSSEYENPEIVKERFKTYLNEVTATQTLFFLIPAFIGIVPEARRSSRGFLLSDALDATDPRRVNFMASSGFYLPASLTISTWYDSFPSQRERALLGPRLTGEQVKEAFVGILPSLREQVPEGPPLHEGDEPLRRVDLSDVEMHIRYRRQILDWDREELFYRVEGGYAQWREQVMREIERQIPQTFLCIDQNAFISKTQPFSAQSRVVEKVFTVISTFTIEKSVYTNEQTFNAEQGLILVCNSTTLLIRGTLYDSEHQDEIGPNMSHFMFNAVAIANVWEVFITAWEGSTLRVGMSDTRRHVGSKGYIYFGNRLGRQILVDRTGKTRPVPITTDISQRVSQVLTEVGHAFNSILAVFRTDNPNERYLVLCEQLRVILDDTLEHARVTRTMLLTAKIYLLTLITGIIVPMPTQEELNQAPILPMVSVLWTTESRASAQEERPLLFRNVRNPRLQQQTLAPHARATTIPIHL